MGSVAAPGGSTLLCMPTQEKQVVTIIVAYVRTATGHPGEEQN